MAKRIRALTPKKLSTVCTCKEAAEGEHECPAIGARAIIANRQRMQEEWEQWERNRNKLYS